MFNNVFTDSLFKDIIEHTEATELSNIEDNDAHLYEQYLEYLLC
jgi:hypothetical protein